MDTDIALLASEERTKTVETGDVRSAVEDSGVMLFLDITKAPNTAETLKVEVQAKDTASGKYVTITAFTASKKGEELGEGATLAYLLSAGASETQAVANLEGQALPLPRHWRVVVTHSGAGKWTYSLGYQFVS